MHTDSNDRRVRRIDTSRPASRPCVWEPVDPLAGVAAHIRTTEDARGWVDFFEVMRRVLTSDPPPSAREIPDQVAWPGERTLLRYLCSAANSPAFSAHIVRTLDRCLARIRLDWGLP